MAAERGRSHALHQVYAGQGRNLSLFQLTNKGIGNAGLKIDVNVVDEYARGLFPVCLTSVEMQQMTECTVPEALFRNEQVEAGSVIFHNIPNDWYLGTFWAVAWVDLNKISAIRPQIHVFPVSNDQAVVKSGDQAIVVRLPPRIRVIHPRTLYLVFNTLGPYDIELHDPSRPSIVPPRFSRRSPSSLAPVSFSSNGDRYVRRLVEQSRPPRPPPLSDGFSHLETMDDPMEVRPPWAGGDPGALTARGALNRELEQRREISRYWDPRVGQQLRMTTAPQRVREPCPEPCPTAAELRRAAGFQGRANRHPNQAEIREYHGWERIQRVADLVGSLHSRSREWLDELLSQPEIPFTIHFRPYQEDRLSSITSSTAEGPPPISASMPLVDLSPPVPAPQPASNGPAAAPTQSLSLLELERELCPGAPTNYKEKKATEAGPSTGSQAGSQSGSSTTTTSDGPLKECIICCEEFMNSRPRAALLDCGHADMCMPCTRHYMRLNYNVTDAETGYHIGPTCPTCRARITQIPRAIYF